jgi:hypothetical protein
MIVDEAGKQEVVVVTSEDARSARPHRACTAVGELVSEELGQSHAPW